MNLHRTHTAPGSLRLLRAVLIEIHAAGEQMRYDSKIQQTNFAEHQPSRAPRQSMPPFQSCSGTTVLTARLHFNMPLLPG